MDENIDWTNIIRNSTISTQQIPNNAIDIASEIISVQPIPSSAGRIFTIGKANPKHCYE